MIPGDTLLHDTCGVSCCVCIYICICMSCWIPRIMHSVTIVTTIFHSRKLLGVKSSRKGNSYCEQLKPILLDNSLEWKFSVLFLFPLLFQISITKTYQEYINERSNEKLNALTRYRIQEGEQGIQDPGKINTARIIFRKACELGPGYTLLVGQ